MSPNKATKVAASMAGRVAWSSHSGERSIPNRLLRSKDARPHQSVTQYMDGLQRVVNDYQPPIRRRTEEGAKQVSQGNSDDFANEGNLDSCIAYLSTNLSGELQRTQDGRSMQAAGPQRGQICEDFWKHSLLPYLSKAGACSCRSHVPCLV